jgi:hypothetical protein
MVEILLRVLKSSTTCCRRIFVRVCFYDRFKRVGV